MKMIFALIVTLSPCLGHTSEIASTTSHTNWLDLTQHTVGYAALTIFVIAYTLVIAEEFLHLRKSKPVILASGIIWAIIAAVYANQGMTHEVENAVRHNLLEYAELMLFLLVAMTYINAMEERKVFDALRSWLVAKGFSFKQLFWLTGILAFFISPIADNLTTALLMCAVVMAVGGDNKKFISISCINIVVSANAGGAFSPFGDITTLMVWQKGIVEFQTFFLLFVPSAVNYLIPAFIMSFFISNDKPQGSTEIEFMKRGAKRIIGLFLVTISFAVCFHNFLHLPPVVGMFTGLSLLQIFSFYLKRTHQYDMTSYLLETNRNLQVEPKPIDIFDSIARAEWDTLLFFYGVVLCVGGLGFIG